MTAFERLLRQYDYRLPPEAVAHVPASPRDAAQLLVYQPRTQKVAYSTFAHLAEFLPKGALLVFNETKVIPARLLLRKETGGKVEALVLRHRGRSLEALATGRLRPGDLLSVQGKHFTVLERKGTSVTLRMEFTARSFPALLRAAGATPLPPYLKHSPLTETQRRQQYQSIFARRAGSIAAPTASLHFTNRVLQRLKRKGITTARITLHVHLGTFAPLTQQHVRSGKLHEEVYDIPPVAARAIRRAREKGRPIIAVGTTVVRALESAAVPSGVRTGAGLTRLFMRPGYNLRVVDGLITNFHVPRSSLLMLVAAFVGRTQLLRLYQQARRHHFRFFSFGDGMLVLPPRS